MATKAALSEAEYLRTSFPGVDQEFHDGELVERSMPDRLHSAIQRRIVAWMANREKAHRLFAYPELRVRVKRGRFVIPDVCVYWPEDETLDVPENSPLIAIEILSEDDRMSKVRDKLQEYKDWGVVHVWLVDPRRKVFYEFEGKLHEVDAFQIPEAGLELTPADIFD